MTIKLTTIDGTVLEDEAEIVAYLKAAAIEASSNIDAATANDIIAAVNETKVDDDPIQHISDIIEEVEGVLAEREDRDATDNAQSSDSAILVSVHPNAARAYAFAIESLKDEAFNEDIEQAFKSQEFRQKGALLFLLDLQRIHGDDLKSWPRVPLTDEEKKADLALAEKQGRNSDTFAYKEKRNNKEVKRTFPQNYFDRTQWGQTCLRTIDDLKLERDGKLKAGSYNPAEIVALDGQINTWTQRHRIGSLQVLNAMRLGQQINDIRSRLPLVELVIHTQEVDGRLVPTFGKDPFLLMASDPKLQGYKSNQQLSSSSLLTLDIDKALANGGTVEALVMTNKRAPNEGEGEESKFIQITNAKLLQGASFAINVFFDGGPNERHLRTYLDKKAKGDVSKLSEESEGLLWTLGELRDNLNRLFHEGKNEERYLELTKKKSAA